MVSIPFLYCGQPELLVCGWYWFLQIHMVHGFIFHYFTVVSMHDSYVDGAGSCKLMGSFTIVHNTKEPPSFTHAISLSVTFSPHPLISQGPSPSSPLFYTHTHSTFLYSLSPVYCSCYIFLTFSLLITVCPHLT